MSNGYCISSYEPTGKVNKIFVPCPPMSPSAGTVLEFTTSACTLAGVSYNPGDKLILIARTSAAPHNRISSLGNWLVKCKHFTSVWTNIEWGIAEKLLNVAQDSDGTDRHLMKLRFEGRFEIYENTQLGLRMARPRNGQPWFLTDLKNERVFDQSTHRHDLAEQYNLKLELES